MSWDRCFVPHFSGSFFLAAEKLGVVKRLKRILFFEFSQFYWLGWGDDPISSDFFQMGVVQPPTSLGWSQVEFPSLLKSCSSHAVSDDLVFCLQSLNAMETHRAGLKTWGPQPPKSDFDFRSDVTWSDLVVVTVEHVPRPDLLAFCQAIKKLLMGKDLSTISLKAWNNFPDGWPDGSWREVFHTWIFALQKSNELIPKNCHV